MEGDFSIAWTHSSGGLPGGRRSRHFSSRVDRRALNSQLAMSWVKHGEQVLSQVKDFKCFEFPIPLWIWAGESRYSLILAMMDL